jgi:integrase
LRTAPRTHSAHFYTLLAERDVSIEVIRELAGHAEIRTTRRYITSPTPAATTP